MNQFSRMINLISEKDLLKIKNKKILLVGVGGVGASCLNELVRTGFSNITIIDNDTIDITNLNRQLITNHTNIGLKKVIVAKKYALDINPKCNINAIDIFLLKEDINNLDKDYDYIIDCCDTVTTKLDLVLFAKKYNINIISSCGTGNRLDPTKLVITDIYNTKNDPLARVLRNLLKKNNISSLKVVTSIELPIKSQEYISTVSFVPNAAGIYLAYEVFRDILNQN